jgi:RNA polymerase sigma-70 factor (ECF subfamily)
MESTGTGKIVALERAWQLQFEEVFKDHFKSLHSYAYTIVKDDIMAEEMVQNVFYKLWEKKGQIEVTQSVTAYLYRSVYNESLNYLKHLKVREAHQAYVKHQPGDSNNAAEHIRLKDLKQNLDRALSELPEQCRTVFQMSRFEELKYQEIADRLSISVKTVENHMGKALRLLREKLVDFLPAILLILLNL